MIYLIGGAPRCGKTILSRRLATQKNCSWISTDTIRQMVFVSTPKNLRDKKFPYSKLQRAAEPYTDVNQNPPSVLLRAEITESKSVWPSVRVMIEDFIECKQSYIIEGVHLMPDLVQQLKNKSYWDEIRLVYLVKTDKKEIIDGFSLNKSEHDWLNGAIKKQNTELLKKVAAMVQTKSRYIAKLANHAGFTVVDTGKNFEEKIAKLSRKF